MTLQALAGIRWDTAVWLMCDSFKFQVSSFFSNLVLQCITVITVITVMYTRAPGLLFQSLMKPPSDSEAKTLEVNSAGDVESSSVGSFTGFKAFRLIRITRFSADLGYGQGINRK